MIRHKIKFRKCIMCFNNEPCGSKERLPRKQKKLLKKVMVYIEYPFMRFPTMCDIQDAWKYSKKWVRHLAFLNKYKNAIQYIFNLCEGVGEPAGIEVIDGKLELTWFWEHDNGLYTEDGSMKAIYDEELFDKTWSGSETKGMIRDLMLDYDSIHCFRDLVLAMDKQMKIWGVTKYDENQHYNRKEKQELKLQAA